jgi:hypothetical protein
MYKKRGVRAHDIFSSKPHLYKSSVLLLLRELLMLTQRNLLFEEFDIDLVWHSPDGYHFFDEVEHSLVK